MKINSLISNGSKQIIIGCIDGSLRIFNFSSKNNIYNEYFHYEVGQENIENNKTQTYNSKTGIEFKDKDEKIKILKWKSIKDVYRRSIIGITVPMNDFILTIGYTKDGK